MIDPTAQDIGRRVAYVAPGADRVEGTLDRFNSAYAFVTFDVIDRKSGGPVAGATSSATAFDELQWCD